jgi:hypothetical protein
MSDYEKVCKVCDSRIPVSGGSRDFAEWNECNEKGLDWLDWCSNCQKETKQEIKEFIPLICQKAKKSITRILKYYNLKTSDLSVEFQNWEVELDKLDNWEELKDFETKIQAEIQKQAENSGLSLPVKLLIGWGVFAVLIALVHGINLLHLKKQKGEAKVIS